MLIRKTNTPAPRTIVTLLRTAERTVEPLDAALLLAHVLKMPREYFITHQDEQVSRISTYRFRQLCNKRASGVPLAYLTGHKAFFGLDFFVNKYTLVPRPDTECLAESVLAAIRKLPPEAPLLLVDIGTGSGCIPVAIAHTMQKEDHAIASILATDISRGALKVAKKNAALHGVRATFIHGNLLTPSFARIEKYLSQTNQPYIFLTANLPYLCEEQYDHEPSIQHEPKTALVAPESGLAHYRKLFGQLQQLLKKKQATLVAWLEIDPSQTKKITKLISSFFPQANVRIIPDGAGAHRVVEISFSRL